MVKSERINLSSIPLDHLPLKLIESHLRSYELLLKENVWEIFNEVNPISDYTGESWELTFTEIEWGKENIKIQDALKLGLSYDKSLYVHTKLLNKKTGEIKKQKLFVADVPLMSDRATFVINGNERVVVMQIVRAEGILFFQTRNPSSKKPLYAVKLMPLRGRWFDFEVNKHGVMSVKLLDKRPRILLTSLIRALGYSSDQDLKNLFEEVDTGDVKFLETTLKKDPTSNTEEALLDIYRKLRPEDSINIESAKEFIKNMFFNKRSFYLGKIGRYQLNKKLNRKEKVTPEDYTLYKSDLVNMVKALIKLNNGTMQIDDIDSLANRRIRGVGELIGEKIRIGVMRMEKNIKDRMSTYSADEIITPSVLINTRPVIAAINQFFGSSQVSRYMDQQNPLSEIETKRRITAGGPRGLTKERATFSVRDVHSSHYSKLCMVTTPEGTSIGIVSHMAIYGRVNDYGFLEAPYKKVIHKIEPKKDGKKILINRILSSDLKNSKGKVMFKKGHQLSVKDSEKIIKGKIELVEIIPYISSEVDYLDADDELKVKTTPAIINKDEFNNILAKTSFVRQNISYAKVPVGEIDYIDINPGQIGGIGFSLLPFSFNDDPTRTLMASNMQRQAVPLVNPKSPIVGTGYEKKVAEASKRCVIAETDGIVTYADSEKVIIKYKGSKEQEFEVEKFVRTNQNTSFSQLVRVNTGDKFKKDEVLIDGPAIENGELAIGRNVTAAFMVYEGFNYEDGIIISERLIKDDVFTSVHIKEYIQDIRETKLGNEQITKDIPNVGDYLVRNLDENGIVRIGAKVESRDVLVGIIAPKGETELTPEEKLLRAIFGEYARDVRDNSLKLPHGDRGIVIGVQILDKTKGDKLNPGVLKQVKVWVAKTDKVSVGDKLTGLHGDKGVISKVLPVEDMPYLEDGTPIDIILSPMFVKRMNIGGIRELETAKLAEALGIKVEVPPFVSIDSKILTNRLKKEGKKVDIKVDLYDGRSGEKFDNKIVVGPRYILKLDHLSADKIHARSTGSYTMVTQQPLGGKAQFGGQRFGEMEVWALEAHATPSVLHEMLTIKSDDVIGRAAAYKSIIQGQPIDAPNIPESFKVFISELRALGVNVDMVEKQEDDTDLNEIVEGIVDDTITEPKDTKKKKKATK